MSETPAPTPPPTTPAAPPAPAVKDSGEYFNSSRLKIIGLITAATVAVGALGGIAGVAFDPDPVDQDNLIQPGGDGSRLAPQGGSLGNSAPHGRAQAITRAVPGADATATPSSVGTVSPGSGGLSSSPGAETEGTDTPAPSDGDGGSGEGTTIAATDVDVFVPAGWHVDMQDDNRVFQSDDQNNFSFAFSYVDAPSVAAGDVISQNIEDLLPGENYTQLETSDVVTLDPFGSVVSLAGIEYEALWVDNQGSISVHGQIYVAVRQDGTVLGILLEHAPAEEFEAAFEDMMPILDNSYARFAGLG
jgi:hypothetical protein